MSRTITPRTFLPADLVALPRLDANGAGVLALKTETAAEAIVEAARAAASAEASAKGASPEAVKAAADKAAAEALPPAVVDALDDVRTSRERLQAALGGKLVTESEVREADRDEDVGIGGLFDLIDGWARFAGRLPQGDLAVALRGYINPDGTREFINWPVELEYGAVDVKLKTIDREGLEPKLAELGLLPALGYLRAAHQRYGEAIGVLQPQPAVESANVVEPYKELLEAIRQYVVAVSGSVRRKKPETQALADTLLRPIAEWETRVKKKGEEAPAGGAAQPAKGGEEKKAEEKKAEEPKIDEKKGG